MSEALRKQAPEPALAYAEPLADLLPPLVPAEHNDNETATELLRGNSAISRFPGAFGLG